MTTAKRQIAVILLVSFLLGLMFDWLFYGKVPGISVFIYSSLILGFTVYLAYRFKWPLSVSVYGLIPVILFFSFMTFVRANVFLAFINILLIIYLLGLMFQLARQPAARLNQYGILDYFNFMRPRSSLIFLPKFFAAVSLRLINDSPPAVRKSSYIPIIRGLVISLPILVIFLLLLSSADLVFKKYIDSLFDFNVDPETIFRWGLIGFITSLFLAGYALIFIRVPVPESTTPERKKFDLGATEASIILGSVSLLFFVFVVVQLAYLFGGSGQITSVGYTYAEYARKGFFELIAVAVMSLLLILTIKKFTKLPTLPQTVIFKWFSGILIVEVMVIMLSAHMRLNLYEDAYGFTTLRLLSHIFIAWLAAAFILLLLNIIRGKGENQLAFRLFLSVIGFFLLINFINLDAFIARQNIDRFNHVGKLDVDYLSSLSEDAVPAVAGFLDHPNAKVRKSAAQVLYDQRQSFMNSSDRWQSTNLSKKRADQVFRDNAAQVEAGKP